MSWYFFLSKLNFLYCLNKAFFSHSWAKIKQLFVSRTRPTIRKCCDSKYYLGDLQRLFFWLPAIVTGSSDIVPEFTFGTGLHFYMNKIRCSTLKKPDLWMNFKKKNYLPTHRWNGGSGAGNEHIFKGGLCILSWLQLLCQSPLPYNADYLQERSDLQKETRRLQFCFGVNFIGILWTEANKYFKVNFIHLMYKHVIITKH